MINQIKEIISIFFISLAVMIFWSFPPTPALANWDDIVSTVSSISMYKSFGGKITMTTIPSVTCFGGTGPVTITPAGSFAGSNYYLQSGGNKTNNQPKNGAWVLGLYLPTQPRCTQDVKPYSVKPSTYYGVSGFGN